MSLHPPAREQNRPRPARGNTCCSSDCLTVAGLMVQKPCLVLIFSSATIGAVERGFVCLSTIFISCLTDSLFVSVSPLFFIVLFGVRFTDLSDLL